MCHLPSFLLLLGALPWTVAPASAQDAAKPTSHPIQLRVLAEVVPENLGQVYVLAGKTQTPAFDLPANNVSEPILVHARELQLNLVTKDLALCKFVLPEAGSSFIVIFCPTKPAGYRAEVIRADDPSFKRGDVFFINRTDKIILGKLGSKRLTIPPATSTISRPQGATSGTYYDIAFAARDPSGDKLLSTVRWPVDEQIRSYMFFIQDANGRVSYRAVDEFIGAAAPAAVGN